MPLSEIQLAIPPSAKGMQWRAWWAINGHVRYESVDNLIHVHGHGAKNTGHLEPAYCIGDVVIWNCMEGFGGVAEVLAVRNAEPSIMVKMLQPCWTEHSYQPESWAFLAEITRCVR